MKTARTVKKYRNKVYNKGNVQQRWVVGAAGARKYGRLGAISSNRNYFRMGSDDSSARKYYDGLTTSMNDEDKETTNSGEFFLAATSLNDHHITKIVNERTRLHLNTKMKKEIFVSSRADWEKFIYTNYDSAQIIEYGPENGIIIQNLNFIDYVVTTNTVAVRFYGDPSYIEKNYNACNEKFYVARCNIEWIYSTDGSSVTIPMTAEKLPVSEMYPFLNGESVQEYYDRYLKSSASILLLIGPPGTGKTTFIRGLLHHSGKDAVVTYDEKILERDYVFASFLEDSSGVMVIEDADNFLRSREDGNNMMHRFLNVGDGLISIRGKKLIFSTNLPTINDIDPALIRPGRCFDVVRFDNYTLDQAKSLAKTLKINFEEKPSKSDTYSLAELFFKQNNTKPTNNRKMGFV